MTALRIGGAFTRFGFTEVLYVTEFIGLALIFLGYQFAVSPGLELGEAVAGIPRRREIAIG